MKRTKPILLCLCSLFLAVSVGAQTFVGADVGTPALAGSVTGTAPGIQTIVGGGDDIWNQTDNFYYVYTSVTGQVWDARVRVHDLQGPDHWSKCELMVRVPDATGIPKGPDPFFAAMTTRAAGQNQVAPQWRPTRGGDANWDAMGLTIAPTYPNTWMRITRMGSMLTMYYGTDGVNWTKYGDLNTASTTYGFGNPFPDPVLVGVAVTAHNNGDLTGGVATISDLSVTVTPTAPNLTPVTQVQDATTYVGSDAFFSFVVTNSAIANGSAANYQWYKNGQAIANATGRNYALFAAPEDNGALIHCVASLPGASVNSATGTVTVLTPIEVSGSLKYQVYSGRSRADLNTGNYGPASRVSAMSAFEAPVNWSDNFASRLSGYFIPPTTGDYTFFISADDDADLWLGTNSSPASVRLIAQQEGWAGNRQWVTHGGGGSALASFQRRSDNWTPDGGLTYPYVTGIPLVAGQKYFIMATHREGGGGDNLGVYAKLHTAPDPLDGDPSNLTGPAVSMLTWTSTTLNVTDPTDLDVFEGLNAVMSVTATTDSELTPQYQWQRNGVDMAGRTARTLNLSPANLADNGAQFRCIVSIPGTGLSVTSAPATLTVQASVFITGIVRQEIWGPNNTSVTRDQVNNGAAGEPTSTGFLTMFDTPDFADNYVQKLSTWFVPAVNGNYVFLLSSDDDSDLFLSTNDDPANKRLIAQQGSWNGNRNWSGASGQRRSDSFSPDGGLTYPFQAGIPLTAGQQYYIEAVHHEGGGGDNLAVYALLTTDAVPSDGTPSNLTGPRVGVKLPRPSSLSISTQPQPATTHGWDPAVFTIGVTTDALYPPTYQWRRNGANIANATGQTYSFVTGTNDHGVVIDCVVTLSQFGSVTSSPAAVTVLGDAVFQAGTLKEEYFTGVNFQNLLDGNVGFPTQVDTWTILQSRTNIADNFARRVSGFFIPAVSGDYVIFTSSDDQSNFYISTDHQPHTKRLVAQQPNWNAANLWVTGDFANQRRSDQWSPDGGTTVPYGTGIPLVAGNRYYIEVLFREGSGGDNLACTFKLFTDLDPVDGDASLFTGGVIGHMAAPAPSVRPELSIRVVGGNVEVSWSPAGGQLQSKPALDAASWSPAGSANPTILPISAAAQMYFRVVAP